MRAVVVLMVVATGCGRINFRALDGDSGIIEPDDAQLPTNLAFVTSAAMTAAFGGTAAADSMCSSLAMGHGLPGKFVAWLASTGVNASTRLGSARGWKRVDGAPVADTIDGLLGGIMFNTLDVDESGALVADNYAFTGTKLVTTEMVGMTCNDWQGTGGMANLAYLRAGFPDAIDGAIFPCTTLSHLYCFGIDYSSPVSPHAIIGGRIAFLSMPVALGGGRGALDTQCRNEATAASLPGLYLAAAATTTETIVSRFTVDARPWQRVDGTKIGDGAALFATSGRLDSLVNQRADGTYDSREHIWTGAADATVVGTNASTCGDWMVTTGTGTSGAPGVAEPATLWAILTAQSCADATIGVLCLQQ